MLFDSVSQLTSQPRFNTLDEHNPNSGSQRNARTCERQHHVDSIHSLDSEDADGLGNEACSGDFQRGKTGSDRRVHLKTARTI